jgi:hypothetical protein
VLGPTVVEEHDVDVGARAELAAGVRAERDDREAPGEVEVLGDLVERRVERVRERAAVADASQTRIVVDPGPRGAQTSRRRRGVVRGRPVQPRPCGFG